MTRIFLLVLVAVFSAAFTPGGDKAIPTSIRMRSDGPSPTPTVGDGPILSLREAGAKLTTSNAGCKRRCNRNWCDWE